MFLKLITVQILDVAAAVVHPTHCSSVPREQFLSFSFLLLCLLVASVLPHVPKEFNYKISKILVSYDHGYGMIQKTIERALFWNLHKITDKNHKKNF
jgi:hypothetical protein